jgi:regulation of enolase protein 1 (concanavalin A-like superfamily)
LSRAQGVVPPPWLDADIGGPTVAGSSSESAGTFTLEGAGSDIGGTADQAHFVYQQVTGDLDISVQVTGLEPAHVWTKGGVMVREGLAANARNAFVLLSAARGSVFQRRVGTGGPSTSTGGGGVSAPAWVRLVRAGDLFSAYLSQDGTSWTLIGTDTIVMPATVYVGMAATSHDASQLATLSFADVALKTAPRSPARTSWTGRDIGNPHISGRSSESGGTFSITGSGADIGNASDQFHFMHQVVDGDVAITARLAVLQPTDARSRAGVMIRESLMASAAHAAMLESVARGGAFERRPIRGGSTIQSPGDVGAPPAWVRLVRTGDEFSAYESADGKAWNLVGTETIAMPRRAYVGLAVTSHSANASSTATLTDVTVVTGLTGVSPSLAATETTEMTASATATPLPNQAPTLKSASPTNDAMIVTEALSTPSAAAWTGQDVGNPAIAGSWSQASGTFTVTGAGVDIWDPPDQFQFVAQRVSGNVEIIARLATLQQQNSWSKAGVMIRESLTGSSSHVSVFGTPVNGWRYLWRASTGGASASTTAAGPLNPPGWVRLVRNGNDISGYTSTDGVQWTLAGTQTVAMTADVYVGLAVTSHNASLASTATFTNVSVTVDGTGNQPPTASLTSPTNGASFTAPASIAMAASAADSDGTVSRVEFYQGTTLLGTDTTSPYSYTWSNAPAGTYSLTARATDNTGATTTSAAVSVTVNGTTNPPPTVSLTSPTNGASFTAPASIAMAASAADSNGTITRVDFYLGTTLLGSDTSSPYTFTWANVLAGTYALTARATDNGGATTTSATVNVTVAGVSLPTTLEFTPSSNHSTSVDSYSLALFRAADPPTATPVATTNIGKPVVVNNRITADITTLVNPLPAGSYYGVVTALGPGGSAASAPSATFTK